MTKDELDKKLKENDLDYLVYRGSTQEGTGSYALEFDWSDPFFGSDKETSFVVTELNGAYSIVRDVQTIIEGEHDLIDRIPKSGGNLFVYCSDKLEMKNIKVGECKDSLDKDKQLKEANARTDALIGNQSTQNTKEIIKYSIIGVGVLGAVVIAYKVLS